MENLGLILNELKEILEAESSCLYLYKEERFEPLHYSGLAGKPESFSLSDIKNSSIFKAIDNKQAEVTGNFENFPERYKDDWPFNVKENLAVFPLVDRSGKLEALILLSTMPKSKCTREIIETAERFMKVVRQEFTYYDTSAQLREREEIFRAITTSAQDGIIMMNPEGEILFWNEAAEKIYGYSVEEALGSKAWDLITSTDKKKPFMEAINVLAGSEKTDLIKKPNIYQGKKKNGEIFPVEASYSTAYVNGENCAIAIVRDVSFKKHAEDELRASESKYRSIFENFQDLYYRTSLDGIVEIISPSIKAAGGYDPEELIGKPIGDFYYNPDERKDFVEALKASGQVNNYELRLRHKNGTLLTALVNARIITNSEGKPIAVEGVVRDITDRKLAEDELKKSEERLRSLQENIPVGIFRSTPEGGIYSINKAIIKIFGFDTAKEFNNAHVPDLYVNPDERERLLKILEEEGELNSHEIQFKRKDGTVFWAAETSRAIFSDGKITHIDGIIEDIDLRKRAELALIESERKYRYYIEHISDGIWCYEPPEPIDLELSLEEKVTTFFDTVCTECNKQFAEMYAISREEILGSKLSDIMPSNKKNKAYLEAFFRNGCRVEGAETYEPDFDGNDKWYLNSMFGEIVDGKLLRVWGRQSDITHRIKSEKALKESENRLMSFMDSATDLFLLWDSELRLVEINPAARSFFNTGEDETALEGTPLPELMKDNPLSEFSELYHSVLRGGMPENIDNIPVRGEQGEKILQLRLFKVNEGLGMIGTDITYQKKAEEELNRIQKLESLGVLAGGIAHDFNNLLAAMLSNLSLAKRYIPEGNKAMKNLFATESAIDHATNLTYQLLTFSRGGAPVKEFYDIISLVKETAAFVLRGSNVVFSLETDPEAWNIELDKGQVSQALHNIILNASQAMPEGGEIEIKISNLDANEAVKLGFDPEEYLRIDISDSGVGIPQDSIHKIYDPYYTTKDQGTGLGLASTFSIIKNHKGYIRVKSEVGEGTTFSVFLPARKGEKIMNTVSDSDVSGGEGLILLMDDDKMVREACKELIEFLGYSVISTNEGAKAVEKYRELHDKGAAPDLVILDLTVPGGMGGKGALREIKKINPEVRAIATSGYSTDPILSDFAEFGFSASINKPFSMEQLAGVIKKLLKN